MIRVLHFADPDDARRRIAFLGVSTAEGESLISGLRAFLVSVPLEDRISTLLPPVFTEEGIPLARGRDVILFSLSSEKQLDRVREGEHGAADALAPVRSALARYARREFLLHCRDRNLSLGGPPRIMGILNVTPDSFSDGGRYFSPDAAVRRGLEMADEGADIIDVGGESTRPGSLAVPADDEIGRVIPVLRGLAGKTGALLSVDTTKAEVARRAVGEGAHILNDTSALEDDPDMAEVIRDSGCAVVLMHRPERPETMQRSPFYVSLSDQVLDALSARVDAAMAAGIGEDRIMVDPGIGFGKRTDDNLALHRHLADLRNLGKPILFGPSRKSFIGTITGKEPEDRVFGTAASVTIATMGGAHVIRVHDVKEMRDAIRVASAVMRGAEC